MSLLSSTHIPAFGVSLRRVIQVTSQCGDGTEFNPVRSVTQYWTPSGHLLASYDHMHDDPEWPAFEVCRLRAEVAELKRRLDAANDAAALQGRAVAHG